MAEEERDRKWTVLRLRGLRKRWIVNTILPVLVLSALRAAVDGWDQVGEITLDPSEVVFS